MATLQEQKQGQLSQYTKISEQKDILAQQRTKLRQNVQQLQEQEEVASPFTSQRIPQRKYGTSVTKQQQQEVLANRERAKQFISESQQARQQLGQADIEYGNLDDEYNRALETTRQNIKAIENYSYPERTSSEVRDYARQVKESKQPQITGTVITYAPQQLPAVNVRDFTSGKTEYVISQGGKSVKLFNPATSKSNQELTLQTAKLSFTAGEFKEASNIITSFKQPTDILGRFGTSISEKRRVGGVPSFVAGVEEAGFSLALTTKTIFTQSPIKTIKEFASGTGGVVKTFASGKGFPIISEILITEPQYATGRVFGEIAILKAPRLAVKTSDIFRTTGLKEIDAKRIIAPEYFEGQRFPTIRKGTSAGELMDEFKYTPIAEFGLKPAGFTASPSILKGDTVLKGASELEGLYQAPRLSPVFLKVIGEKKLVGLNLFETLRPSALRIEPTEFIFAKGVRTSTTKIQSGRLGEIRQFFETAPRGSSIIPFIKTEKESIIPRGTLLDKSGGKRYFFEFEGRKIPIFEFKTISGKGGRITEEISMQELVSKYSYKSSKEPLISPLTILSSSKPNSSDFMKIKLLKALPKSYILALIVSSS